MHSSSTPLKLHFITGLPRSGSTLLSSLLSQNPRFQAGISSALLGLVDRALLQMSAKHEYAPQINDVQRLNVVSGIMQGFYAHVEEPVVFDTNRMWSGRIPLLKLLDPEVKLIACVRNVSDILESLEALYDKTPLQPSAITDFQSGNVYSRVNAVWNGSLLGAPHSMLKGAFFGPDHNRILFIRYPSLVHSTDKVMAAVYRFLGEDPMTHNPNEVQACYASYDAKLGTPGLHDIRSTVGIDVKPRRLTPDLIQRYERESFWEMKPARLDLNII